MTRKPIFVHIPDKGEYWRNMPVNFSRVPSVGEHITVDESGKTYIVRIVLHFADIDTNNVAADVYAEPVDHLSMVHNFRLSVQGES